MIWEAFAFIISNDHAYPEKKFIFTLQFTSLLERVKYYLLSSYMVSFVINDKYRKSLENYACPVIKHSLQTFNIKDMFHCLCWQKTMVYFPHKTTYGIPSIPPISIYVLDSQIITTPILISALFAIVHYLNGYYAI